MRSLAAAVFVAGLGMVAEPAHAASVYTPSMVLTVSHSVADTAPNTPCATTLTGSVYVNSGPCGLRGAIDATNQYLQQFKSPCAGAPAPVGQPAVRINVPAGTYVLTQGGLNITGACDSTDLTFSHGNQQAFVQIVGAGPTVTTVDGSGNAPLHPASVFTYAVPLQMSGLTVTGGQGENFGCTDCGGGLNGDDDEGLSLSNMVITHNHVTGNGGGIYENDWNSMSMTNVKIIANAARYGGGIWNDGGMLSMSNATITGNIACDTYLHPTSLPWAPGNMCIDTSTSEGGGIYTNAGVTINKGTISGNVAGSLATGYGSGGGIWNNWSVQLTNVTVTNNIAGNAGGGIQDEDSLAMTGGLIQGNHAGAIAGGLGNGSCDHRSANGSPNCSGSGDQSELFGTTVSGNTAGGTFDCTTTPTTSCSYNYGGSPGGFTVGPCPTLGTGEYCFSSYGVGGGIYNYEALKITGGGVTGNTAASIGGTGGACESAGGGIFNYEDLVYVQGSQLSNNVASCGAGEYTVGYSASNFYSSKIFGNKAAYDGGAIYANATAAPGVIMLNNSIVLGNHAQDQTGGIYSFGYGTFLQEGSSPIVGNVGGSCPNHTYPCG